MDIETLVGLAEIATADAPQAPYKYSPTTKGFYLEEIHGDKIPADAYVVTEAERNAIMFPT